MQQSRLALLALAGFLAFASCGTHESEAQRHQDANTPAGKVGQAAHRAAVEADKAARAIGKKVDKAAHDAREGWNEDAHRNQNSK
jgi:hypothetical protein